MTEEDIAIKTRPRDAEHKFGSKPCTPWTYKRGCHCRGCTDAHTAHVKVQRAERRRRLQAGEADVVHGRASTYGNWGCHCPACSQAWADRGKGAVRRFQARKRAAKA